MTNRSDTTSRFNVDTKEGMKKLASTDYDIRVYGEVDDGVMAQTINCLRLGEGSRAVICADNHLGYSQAVGVAVAYPEHVSVSGVGFDIGCGNKFTLTGLRLEDIEAELPQIMDEIVRRISFGMGRKNNEPAEHAVLDKIREAPFAPQRQLLDTAASQLGTVGAGNHYVDLFAAETGQIGVGVHFGSRGFGHKTASGFLALARGRRFDQKTKEDGMMASPIAFLADSELGQAYIEAMTLAGEYAYAGRDLVVDKVLDILGVEGKFEVHNHHNYAWREEHGGEMFWVVRKGCTPAFPNQLGFVGASMGEESVILTGTVKAEEGLYSTVHGAGRAMSRTQAAGKERTVAVCSDRDCDHYMPWKQYRTQIEGLRPDEIVFCSKHPKNGVLKRRMRIEPGAIDWDAAKIDLNVKGIHLRGGGADEAPGAYKRLEDVLNAHGDSIRVLHRLRPIGVAMAGPDIRDDYRD